VAGDCSFIWVLVVRGMGVVWHAARRGARIGVRSDLGRFEGRVPAYLWALEHRASPPGRIRRRGPDSRAINAQSNQGGDLVT